jgi:hypothetical protein
MLKRTLTGAALTLVATMAGAEPPAHSVRQYLDDLIGKPLFLKVDVLRVQRMLNGQDATNLDRDGKVFYRAHIAGLRSSQSTSAEEFAEEVREQARQDHQRGVNVRSWNRGAPVTIEKVKIDDDQVELDVSLTKGDSKIRFKFDDKEPWGLEDVERLFHAAFAENEAELRGAEESVDIAAGMSPEDVIAKKGAPKTRVNLGAKTIMTYDDMKLVFENGKLVDVQ